jgi:hypothetical protein
MFGTVTVEQMAFPGPDGDKAALDSTDEPRGSKAARLDASSSDPTYTNRLKALISTGPMHELEGSKGLRDAGGLSWQALDLTGLSLTAIDEAVDHMGLVGNGLSLDSLADELAVIAGRHDAHLPVDEARRAAVEVVRVLLNDADNRRAFMRGYAEPSAGYERLRHSFRLLEERDDPERGVIVKASKEAINLIKCALDQDLEDAQVANAAVLKSQLLRGRIDAATATAREARRLSNLYADEILRALETTRRDIRRAGWDGTIPRLLQDALEHLAGRLVDTNELLEHAQDHLLGTGVDDLSEDEQTAVELRQALELVDLLEDCRRTHDALHARLLVAYPTFLNEQDRQIFSRPVVNIDFDPWNELFEPTLELRRDEAGQVVEAFFRGAMGVAIPRAFRLSGLLDALLRPPVVRNEEMPDEEPELVWREVVERRFTDEAERAAATLLAELDQPTRLSALLPAARSAADGADHLVVLLALRWFAPEGDEEGDEAGGFARRRFSAVPLDVIDDGAILTDDVFGGADLLIAPHLTADAYNQLTQAGDGPL